jgi:hypothetical protein
VTESLIDNYGAGGIVCSERRTDCTVTDSAVRGRGPVDDQAQGGIIIRVGASATIVGNIITDHFFTPAKGTKEFSVGIFLFFADPQTNPHLLRDNIFDGNQLQRAAWRNRGRLALRGRPAADLIHKPLHDRDRSGSAGKGAPFSAHNAPWQKVFKRFATSVLALGRPKSVVGQVLPSRPPDRHVCC